MPAHRPWLLPPLLAIVLVLALSGVARGAPPPEPANELSLGWTPRVVLRHDQIASPRLYLGPSWGAVVFRYLRTKGANAHRLELEFLKATLRGGPDFGYLRWPEQEPTTTEGSPATYVRLKYAYLRELPTPSQRLTLRLGPGLDFDIQQFDWVHSPFALGGYLGAFALDVRAELGLRLAPRHRLTATASLPLFAWVARSPYAVGDDELIWANRDHNGAKTFFRYLAGGRFQTWNHFQAARLDLRYDLRLAEHWALGFGLHARVLAYQQPRPVVAQEYGASLAITALF